MTKVSIDTPPLTITVEAEVDLELVRNIALELYRQVWHPQMAMPLAVGGNTVGFTTERDTLQ